MAADPVFVDTNILVYATRPSAAQHAAAKAALTLDHEWRVDTHLGIVDHRQHAARQQRVEDPPGRLLVEQSARTGHHQVQAEQEPPAAHVGNDRHLRFPAPHLGQHFLAQPAGVLDRLLNLLAGSRGAGRQVHDANIVATMLEQGIRRLLTFNAADFRRFGRIIDLEPLS